MFDRNLMKLDGMRTIMAALVLLALLQAATIAGQALTLSLVAAQLWSGAGVEDVTHLIVAFFCCFAIMQLVRFAQETMLDRYSLNQATELHRQLLGRAFDARTMLADREGSAIVATTATEGIDEVQTYIRIIPPKIIGMAAISIPLLIVTYAVDWPSGVILTVMFPVTVFYMVLLGKQARRRGARQYGTYTRLSNRFLDTLRGIDVIKAFGASEHEGESAYAFSEKLRTATVRTMTTATLSGAVLDLCATFGVAAVAMMLAFRLMDGSVALSTGLAALMIAPEYFTPIRSFASDFHASLDGKNALAAVLEMIGDGEHQEVVDNTIAPWNASSILELCDVSYSYDEDGAGIRSLSLSLSGFEKVAVVGKSGTGKSTLAKLVAGFIQPDSGTILLDGSPCNLSNPGWKSQVRIIPQNPYIFRGSLADNISFYKLDATRQQIETAARTVGLDDLLAELPDGLDTAVGEGARGLSGGQAHRVALARILLDDDARVLVFDEPTAHLDIETELELKERMLPLMDGKLVLFATHRLHWTGNMDRIIELDDIASASDAKKAEVER